MTGKKDKMNIKEKLIMMFEIEKEELGSKYDPIFGNPLLETLQDLSCVGRNNDFIEKELCRIDSECRQESQVVKNRQLLRKMQGILQERFDKCSKDNNTPHINVIAVDSHIRSKYRHIFKEV